MAASTKTPSVKVFRDAFLALEPRMTETRRRILTTHYRALGRQLTMTQIAEAVGWSSYSSANSHYGRLAKLVADQVGFRHGGCHLATLCKFVPPKEKGDHWLIIMRAEVAGALKSLGWIDEGGPGLRGRTMNKLNPKPQPTSAFRFGAGSA
jgi:hypothetical protein